MSEILTLQKNKSEILTLKNNKPKDAKINKVKIDEVDKLNEEKDQKDQEVEQDIQEGKFYLFTSSGLHQCKSNRKLRKSNRKRRKNNRKLRKSNRKRRTIRRPDNSDDFYNEHKRCVKYNEETHLNKLHRGSYYKYVVDERSYRTNEFQDIISNDGKRYCIDYFTDKKDHAKTNPEFRKHIVLYGSNNHMGSIECLVKGWFTLDDIKEFLDNMVDDHPEVLNHPGYFLSKEEADRIKQYKKHIYTLYSKLDILCESGDEKKILKQFCDDAINGRDVKGKLSDLLQFLGKERVKKVLECLPDFLRCIMEKEPTLYNGNKNIQETIKLLDKIKNYDKKNIDDALEHKTQELQSCWSLIRKYRINRKIDRLNLMLSDPQYYNKEHIDFINKHTPNGLEKCACQYIQAWEVD